MAGARTFIRDELGRFAKAAGKAAAKEAKKIAKEEAADGKRVAKAKLQARITEAESELSAAQLAANQVEAKRSLVETDSDAADFEVERKRARDRVRKARLKVGGLRAAAGAIE